MTFRDDTDAARARGAQLARELAEVRAERAREDGRLAALAQELASAERAAIAQAPRLWRRLGRWYALVAGLLLIGGMSILVPPRVPVPDAGGEWAASFARDAQRSGDLVTMRMMGSLACDLGDAEGCHLLANATSEDARAATLHMRACNGGYQASCRSVAKMYWIGRGVTENWALAQVFELVRAD